jgi:alpha-glucoside transport system permease protein
MAVVSSGAEKGPSVRRLLLPIGGILGLVIVAIGLAFLADKNGAQNLLGSLFDLIGNPTAAAGVRNGTSDQVLAKLVLGVVALLAGVGGIWLLYAGLSALIGLFRPKVQERLIPWVFVVPAMLLLIGFLVYPTVVTIMSSFQDNTTGAFTLKNWQSLAAPDTITAIRNNIIWLIVGTGGSVILGLFIAAMFDRVRREALAKTFIFLPLAISLVGASVIWRFVYTWRPPGQPQYGLLNAIWTGLGGQPVTWIQTPPVNTYLLILIFIWLQTGFAMVVLSAAIKGVSTEVLEAARLDGASERQIFFKVIVPIIKGSIIAVITTIAIADLKIFDIIYVMTGGRYDTDVVANRMFLEAFQFFNDGRAAALATVLFIGVLPVMYINLKNLRQQGVGA